MTAQRKSDPTLRSESRLSTVEHEVGRVREQLARFSTQLKHVDDTLASISEGMTTITKTMHARSVTDWKTLAAWAGVVLMVLVLYTNLNLLPLKERQIEIRTDMTTLLSTIRSVQADRVEELKQHEREALERGRYQEKVDQAERRLEELEEMVRELK